MSFVHSEVGSKASMSSQDVTTRKSEYRLAAVGILAVIVAIATVVQMNHIIGDIDRITARQQEQQDLLLKSLQEHNAVEAQETQ